MDRSVVKATNINVWPFLASLGIVNLVIGILAIFWPGVTLTVVVFLFGIQLLIIGVLRIVLSLVLADLESRWLGVLIGILGVVVGLLVMREPLRSLEVLVTLVGILWIVWGIIGLIGASIAPAGPRVGGILEGIASVALAIVLLSWPEITVRAFTLVVGIALVAIGLAQLYAAYQTRNIQVQVTAG